VGASERRRRKSNRLVAAAIAVAIVAGVGGGSAIAYASVKSRADRLQAALLANLQAGQHELEAGKAALTQANSNHNPGLITEAVNHFAVAKTEFLAASYLADHSRLLHDLEQVPGAGYVVYSRHTTVDAVAEMGVALSEAGQELAGLDAQLIRPPGTGQAAHTLLTTLDQMQPGLAKVRLELDRAQRAAERVDVNLLPGGQQGTFLKARTAIAAAENGLDEFGRLVPVLKEVLGGNGPRTYLIEQVNPSELRAGGGFIGTYSLLRTDQGRLSLVASGDAYDLSFPRPQFGEPGFIPQPDAFREVIPWVSWSFVDSNIFPDFPSNAKQAETFAQPRLKYHIDGVIAIDFYAVAKMLELTGPLAVPGYSVTVDAESFVAFLAQHDIAQDAIHKAILRAIAGPLMERVSALPPDRWPALISALNEVAAKRHMQAYFNSESVEHEMDRFGWSGVVNPTGTREYMLEVESNYGGSKANYFVSRHYSITLTRDGNTLHHKIVIDLINNHPTLSDENTQYKDYVRLYVGATVSAATHNLRPPKYSEYAPPLGQQLIDGWLPDIACCGGKAQAVFEYNTPWPQRDDDRTRIYWQKQPGVINDAVDVVWNDGSGHTFKVSGDLNQDRVITLTQTGVILAAGQPAQAALPSLNLG
jgi:hypothetical protein